MSGYGVTQDYEYSATHKRQRLQVWSGSFFSVWEADGLSLRNGYVLTTYNGDRVQVSCPVPRDGHNWREVDDAIAAALDAHFRHEARA